MTIGSSALCLALVALPGPAAAAWTIADGKPVPCAAVTTLRDFATGWPGACLGLEQQTGVATYTAQECAAICKANPECTTWQLTAGDTPDQCYIGKPGAEAYSCLGRDSDPTFKPKAAQRLQHGTVTVLQNYTGSWISGLHNVGIFPSTAEVANEDRCKEECYSDINCDYWQYGKDGCWRERKDAKVPTSGPVISTTSDEAKTLVAGEHISHACPPPPAKPEPSHTLRNVLIALGILLLLLLCIAALAFLFCKKETKAKKTRAVKVAQKKAEPLVPVQTVQYVTVPQYSVVQQPAPVMVQQPPAASVVYSSPPVVGSSVVMEQAPLMAGGSVMAPVAMPAAGSVAMPVPTAGSVIVAPA